MGLAHTGEISGEAAKKAFTILAAEGGEPEAIVAEHGLNVQVDGDAVDAAIDAAMAANPDKVEQAKGKPTLAGWFVGQVMKASGGKANPQAVQKIVREKLGIE